MKMFLEKLREITPCLSSTPFENLVENRDGICSIRAESGELTLIPLYKKDDEAAVCIADADDKTIMTWHTHEEKELFIVFSGSMKIHFHDRPDVDLGKGDMYYVLPALPHFVSWTEKSRILAVTIPASKGYPDA